MAADVERRCRARARSCSTSVGVLIHPRDAHPDPQSGNPHRLALSTHRARFRKAQLLTAPPDGPCRARCEQRGCCSPPDRLGLGEAADDEVVRLPGRVVDEAVAVDGEPVAKIEPERCIAGPGPDQRCHRCRADCNRIPPGGHRRRDPAREGRWPFREVARRIPGRMASESRSRRRRFWRHHRVRRHRGGRCRASHPHRTRRWCSGYRSAGRSSRSG